METDPGAVELFLRDYTDGFTELPRSRRSQLGCDYFATDETKLHRITIVHGADEPFSSVAEVAATLGSILYRSDVKWTSISN
ncbi:MAG: hypothetical protein KA436_04325, partial [Oligoflexales bacterium]|nr:hypothetical protein [Oligoflexales bacterium]